MPVLLRLPKGGSDGGEQGFFASLFVTGLDETDGCVATCNGKSFRGVWTERKGNKLELPIEYQKVEYIESSGTQYIDTGIKPSQYNNTLFWSIDVQHNSTGVDYQHGSSISNGKRCVLGDVKTGKWQFGWGDNYESNISVDTNRHTFYQDHANKLYGVDNEAKTYPSGMTTSDYNIYLFARNEQGTVRYNTVAKLYGCVMRDGDTPLRNFVPCYRKSDNVIGLYDLVENKFYPNSGTGTFIKGNDIDETTVQGFYFPKLTELGTYTLVTDSGLEDEILIDAPIEYEYKFSKIPRKGLVAEYLFDGDVEDTSGNDNDLTNSGVTFSNNVGVFNGSSYAVANSGVIPTNSPLSISVWFKTTTTTDGRLVNTSNGTMYGYDILMKNGKISIVNRNNTVTDAFLTTSTLNDGLWHNLVFTWTGATENYGMKVYVDGVLDNRQQATTLVTKNSGNLQIGRYSADSTYYFAGSLDNIRIYNRVLTENEITILYNEGESIHPKLILYSNGDECTDITGGWKSTGYTCSRTVISATLEADHMSFKTGVNTQYATLGMQKAIDLSLYSKLYVRGWSPASSGLVNVCVGTQYLNSSALGTIAYQSNRAPALNVFDITNHTNLEYIAFYLNTATTYAGEIYEVWLE